MGLCCRAFRIKYIIPAGILFLFSFLGSSFKIYSQDSPTVTDVDTISTFAWIENPVAGYINRDFNIEKDYNETTIYKYRKKERFIPYHFVTWKLLNQFTLINSGDLSKSCYYFPGFYYSNTLLYRIKDGKATLLPVIAPDHRDSVSYRLITVPAMG